MSLITVKHDEDISNDEKCDYKALNDTEMSFHRQRKHVGNLEMRKFDQCEYKCEQCDAKFVGKQTLKLHIASKHDGIRLKCDQCDYESGDRRNIKRHISSAHEGNTNMCGQCDAKFVRNHNLTRHIASKHEGIKYKVKCDQCEFKARDNTAIKKHKISMQIYHKNSAL